MRILRVYNYCVGDHSDGIQYIGILKKIDSLNMGIIKLINYALVIKKK